MRSRNEPTQPAPDSSTPSFNVGKRSSVPSAKKRQQRLLHALAHHDVVEELAGPAEAAEAHGHAAPRGSYVGWIAIGTSSSTALANSASWSGWPCGLAGVRERREERAPAPVGHGALELGRDAHPDVEQVEVGDGHQPAAAGRGRSRRSTGCTRAGTPRVISGSVTSHSHSNPIVGYSSAASRFSRSSSESRSPGSPAPYGMLSVYRRSADARADSSPIAPIRPSTPFTVRFDGTPSSSRYSRPSSSTWMRMARSRYSASRYVSHRSAARARDRRRRPCRRTGSASPHRACRRLTASPPDAADRYTASAARWAAERVREPRPRRRSGEHSLHEPAVGVAEGQPPSVHSAASASPSSACSRLAERLPPDRPEPVALDGDVQPLAEDLEPPQARPFEDVVPHRRQHAQRAVRRSESATATLSSMPPMPWNSPDRALTDAIGPIIQLEQVEVVDRVLQQCPRPGLRDVRPPRRPRSRPGSG